MASINKVILIGHLGKDPETRSTTNGTTVTNFNLATSEKFRNKSGENEERTEWHSIQTFGKLAELCGKYLEKGKSVYLEGKIHTRKWQDKDGNTRYTTEVIATDIKFLSPKSGTPSSKDQEYDSASDMPDDDIPF